jgi:hypothetical protein
MPMPLRQRMVKLDFYPHLAVIRDVPFFARPDKEGVNKILSLIQYI